MVAFREFFLKIRNIQIKVVKKIKTHYVFDNAFPKNHAVYAMMWKSMVESDTPQIAI